MRSWRVAFQNIRRSPYQALAAITNLTLTFFVMGVFILIALGSHLILKHFETRPQVIAYLRDQATADEISALSQELDTVQAVNEVKFISKEEALAIYKESVGNDPLLLGTITDLGVVSADILPASLEISVDDPNGFSGVVAVLEQSPAVAVNVSGKKDIDFPTDIVAELTRWTKGLRLSGVLIIFVLAVSSVLTIFTIIGMKIATHKFEISTMKLLGAKGGFIARPFIVESVIYATTGAFFGWVFDYIAQLYATPYLAPQLVEIISLPVNPLLMLVVLAGMWVGALFLGLIAGTMAASRFLKRQ